MKSSELENIDPALSYMQQFKHDSPGTSAHIAMMRDEAIFSEGEIPARTKALAAMLWSINARCEPCLTFYVNKARDLGASKGELNEMLAVASAMGGCIGEMWALKAYRAAYETELTGEDACCED